MFRPEPPLNARTGSVTVDGPRFFRLLCLALALLATAPAHARSLMEMSLEDLMGLTVTSISKRAQPLQETASAVHVVTGEDIRRSGATSIPEALRMVPGLMVGQNSAGTWSIAARGRNFSPTFESRLLVMIDGRSVYSPLFSNVFWESLEVVMEDIDRIEVIRGPGSSAWGANAVNGVINILTKHSADTTGTMVSTQFGTLERGSAAVRHGGRFGEGNSYRIFGKYRNLEGFKDIDGQSIHDGQELGTTGFRLDLQPTEDSTLLLLGDATSGYSRGRHSYPDLGTAGMIQADTTSDILMTNILSRYAKALDSESGISFQAYYSRDDRRSNLDNMVLEMLDLDFQHQFVPLDNHLAQWGLGYRLTSVEGEPFSRSLTFSTEELSANLFSAFVQDEISLGRDVVLTLGSKLEYSDLAGLEFLPSLRLLWRADPEHTFWGGVSRSVRTPSIAENDVTFHLDVRQVLWPTAFGAMRIPMQSSIQGNDGFKAEKYLTWELGHRFIPSSRLFVDTALFLTQADSLLSAALEDFPRLSQDGTHLQLDSKIRNDISATIMGLETSATWSVRNWWTLRGWYAYCEEDYAIPGNAYPALKTIYGRISPRHQFFIRSSMDLPLGTELDIMARYVSELPGLGISDYATVDVRLGWMLTDHAELSLVGKNLIEPRHLESASTMVYGSPGAVERSVFMNLRLEF